MKARRAALALFFFSLMLILMSITWTVDTIDVRYDQRATQRAAATMLTEQLLQLGLNTPEP